MDKQNLQQLFKQPYSRNNWCQLYSAVFAKFEQLATPVEFATTNKKIISLQQLGTITLVDDKKIALFEVEVADNVNLTLNRVELNNTISTFIDQWNTHAAIGVFYQSSSGVSPENPQCSSGFQPENNKNRQDACATLFQPENNKNRQDACATLFQPENNKNRQDACATLFQPENNKNRQDACATLNTKNKIIPFDYINTIVATERNLPHWQQNGTTYFITFRLADSIPRKVIEKIKYDRDLWLKQHTEPYSNEEWTEYNRLFAEKINNLLDSGSGSCVLKDHKISNIIKNALLYFDGQRYDLGEWVIMPNHVHVVVTPYKDFTIDRITHSWKSFTANEINKVLNRTGTLWQDESYDHIVRNEKQLKVIEEYILDNPIKGNCINVVQASSLLNNRRQDACATLNADNRQDACATLNYRFTFAQRQTVWGKDGMKEIKTHSKRYTYVLGPNESCKTAAERFALLAERQATTKMPDLLDAFSVEKLSKQFYNELSNWYFWAIKHVTFPSEPTKFDAKFKNITHSELIQEHNAKNVIRLLTRLLFVWFIKQKKLIPEQLFDLDALQSEILKEFAPYHEEDLFNKANRNSIYYKAILQNLFFASLNCPINKNGGDKRSRGFRLNNNYGQHRDANYMMRYEKYFANPDKFLELVNSVVPFLNGGLFECLDDKLNNSYIDGFSDQMTKGEKLEVPDFLFFGTTEKTDLTAEYGIKNKATKEASVKGLINILKAYNFTIVENTPIDEEVALDPELLGKVFENLLASYNPETKTTARKQTGSFYTPREIVDYMVDESLKASIAHTVAEKLDSCTEADIKAGLDILFAYTDTEHPFNDTEAEAVMNVVAELKILDPACGSGAFPMGILHKLVFILEKLDPDNIKWRNIQKTKALQDTDKAYNLGDETERHQRLDEIREAFDFNSSNYGRKLFLIENSIYGVDIQPIAIQISKLRFFISLVVDQNVAQYNAQCSSGFQPEKKNKNRQDACATLSNFGIRPLPNLETQFVTANTLIGIEKDEDILFDNTEVKQLEAQLQDVRHRLFSSKSPSHKRDLRQQDEHLRSLIAEKLIENGFVNESAQQLAQWDPYDQNASSPFFDMKWMFGIKDGFDIVIGNPPYVQIQKFSGQQCQQDWQNQKYKTFSRTGDIYSLFYERGWQLLKPKAHLCFITSNKWMRANYGKGTRAFFMNNSNIKQLIDFGDAPVFDSATTYTNIMIFAKEQQTNSSHVWDINSIYKKNLALKKMLSTSNESTALLTDDAFVILSPEQAKIKQRIEQIGTPLKECDVAIYRGILTGLNEAFIISGQTKEELIAKDPKSAEIIKPILRGRDIKQYSANFADLWLISTFPALNFDIEKYPVVRDYLGSFGAKLNQTGELYIDEDGYSKKSRKKTGNKWFETQDQIAYYQEFSKEKIIWLEMSPKSNFAYSTDTIFALNTGYIMTGTNLKYLIAVLNSTLLSWYFPLISTDVRGNTRRYIKQYVEKLPIPKISKNQQKLFEELVGKILELTKNGDHLRDLQKKYEFLTLEVEIDARVAHLYDLTEEEYAVILKGTEDDFRIKALNFHRNLIKGLRK